MRRAARVRAGAATFVLGVAACAGGASTPDGDASTQDGDAATPNPCDAVLSPPPPPAAHPSVAPPSPPPPPAPSAAVASGPDPRAEDRRDVGRVDAGAPLSGMSLRFRLSDAQRADRDALLAAQQDPASPSYRRWLTPAQYAARFGATPAAVEGVRAWLRGAGFDVGRISRAGTRIFFSGDVGQVERAFSTEIHRYEIDGELHAGPAAAPKPPASIAPWVLGLRGADDFDNAPAPRGLVPAYTSESDAGSSKVNHGLFPEDFAKIYDLEPLYAASPTRLDGTGVSIAIVGVGTFHPSDIAAFRHDAGLPPTTIADVLVPESAGAPASAVLPVARQDLMLGEATLDLEWAGGVAPGAHLVFVHTGDNANYNIRDAIQHAIDEATAPIVSASFSSCEETLAADSVTEWTDAIDQANAEGITVVAASGDAGAGGCDPLGRNSVVRHGFSVQVPASMPGVTAVGGTSVTRVAADWSPVDDDASGSVVVPPPPALFPLDVAWNDSYRTPVGGVCTTGLFSSGGGASRLFSKPAWQRAPGVPDADHRFVPDIALSAGGGGVDYETVMSITDAEAVPDHIEAHPATLEGNGGTSASTPSFAGILAILNQALVARGALRAPGLGNVNPTLYALYANNADSGAFRDVVSGDNCVPCAAGSPDCPAGVLAPCKHPGSLGLAAGPGYDPVTGLGTVDAAKLVSAWTSLGAVSSGR